VKHFGAGIVSGGQADTRDIIRNRGVRSALNIPVRSQVECIGHPSIIPFHPEPRATQSGRTCYKPCVIAKSVYKLQDPEVLRDAKGRIRVCLAWRFCSEAPLGSASVNIYLFFISLRQIAALLEMDLNKFGRDTVLGSNTTFRVSETPFWVSSITLP
jgi:hypothetical protein